MPPTPRAITASVLLSCVCVFAAAGEPATPKTQPDVSTSFQKIETLLRTGDATEACVRLQRLAEREEPSALFALGFLQEMGAGLVLDAEQSLENLTKSAERGHKPAAGYLSWKFEQGFLTKPDPQKSAHFRGLAGEGPLSSTPIPDDWLGVSGQIFTPKLARAFLWLANAASEGDAVAQYNIAQYYFEGRHTSPDYRLYLRFLKQSADKNFGPAALQLSRLYRLGLVVNKDPEQADRYLRVAADAGLPDAQYDLAEKLLESGSPGTAEGLRLLALAAEKKHPEASLELGRRFRSGDGLPQDEVRALAIFQNAADSPDSNTLDEVAYAYESGSGTARNLEQARNLYEKSAARGSAYAKYRLGMIALDGAVDGKPDHPTALRWLEAASEDGNLSAMFQLGEMHRNGQGVTADPSAAFAWYERAAREGDISAQKMTAWCLASGTGIERDYEEAVTWYALAAKKGDGFSIAQLGFHYANGLGVERNLRTAKDHFLNALRVSPDSTNQILFGSSFIGLPKDCLPEARTILSEQLLAFIDQPDPLVESIIVDILLRGPAEIRDKETATAHLERRAAGKTLWALEALSQEYLDGPYLPQNYKKLYDYAQQAASLPDPAAGAALGFLQVLGVGCSIDEAGGIALLEKAAPTSGRASFWLMHLHIFGLGVPEDRSRAAAHLTHAAKLQFQPAVTLLALSSGDAGRAVATAAPSQPQAAFDEREFERNLAARIQNKRDMAPASVWTPRPVFPPRLRFLGQNGEATIRFVLTTDGRTTEVVALTATHADFAVAAMTAVKQWRYLPPVTNGEVKSVRMQIPVIFNLDDK